MSSTKPTQRRAAGATLAAVALAAGVALTGLAGCRGDRTDKPPRMFFPDMDHQRSWKPQEETGFFPNQRTQRTPVEGTVAFGPLPLDYPQVDEQAWAEYYVTERASYLRESTPIFQGLQEEGGQPVKYIPIEVTQDLIERGQERFNIFCTACHGVLGNGLGPVGRAWSYAPANMLLDIYRDYDGEKGSDGHLFRVIRYGVGEGSLAERRMPGYAHKIDEIDSWAIVAYIRVLQRSQNATLEDLTPDERRRLDEIRAAGAAAPAPDTQEQDTQEQDTQEQDPAQSTDGGQE